MHESVVVLRELKCVRFEWMREYVMCAWNGSRHPFQIFMKRMSTSTTLKNKKKKHETNVDIHSSIAWSGCWHS